MGREVGAGLFGLSVGTERLPQSPARDCSNGQQASRVQRISWADSGADDPLGIRHQLGPDLVDGVGGAAFARDERNQEEEICSVLVMSAAP